MLEPSVQPVRLVPEPKPGGVRWLVHLDPVAEAAYAAGVAPLVPAIEAALPPNVVANRVAEVRTRPPAVRLEAWSTARARFRALVDDLAADAGAALVADVRDCYGSITLPVLGRALGALGCAIGEVERAIEAVGRLREHGVRGLPIGPEPSAVLANAVLLAVDARLGRAGFRHVRWVDDVVVFARDAAGAREALEVLEQALAGIGLRLALEKTRVVADPRSLGTAWAAGPSGAGARPGGPNG